MLLTKSPLGIAFKVVKIGGGAFAAYQAFKLWRSMQGKND
jgi:threonine/homoserine/homoserine lactone efflux protein